MSYGPERIAHRTSRRRVLACVAVTVCQLAIPGHFSAQPTTEHPASILFFPKVVANSEYETVIQITSQHPVGGALQYSNAACFYLDGSLFFPALPPGPGNPQRWQQTNFDIALPQEHPVYWVAGQGRRDHPDPVLDPPCSSAFGAFRCPGGLVPPVPSGFDGGLICIEVDAQGLPVSGNHLIGSASIRSAALGETAQYNAIGLRGLGTNDSDDVLCLGGTPRAGCPLGAEYDACPTDWNWDHPAHGADDPLAGSDAFVSAEFTVFPCSQNFLLLDPPTIGLVILVYDEFGSQLSQSFAVTCWSTFSLDDDQFGGLFDVSVGVSDFVRSRVIVTTGEGVILVAGESRLLTVPGTQTTTAANIHHFPPTPGIAEIRLPER